MVMARRTGDSRRRLEVFVSCGGADGDEQVWPCLDLVLVQRRDTDLHHHRDPYSPGACGIRPDQSVLVPYRMIQQWII